MQARHPIDLLRVAVDELAELDPVQLSDPALGNDLIALRRQMDRQEAAFARLAHAAKARGIGGADGAASTAAWLRHRAGMREGDAKAAIDCGAVFEILTETGRAWRAGEVSTGAARTISAARVEGHDDELAACEPELLDLARRNDLRSLRVVTAHFRKLALGDGAAPGEQDGLYVSRLYEVAPSSRVSSGTPRRRRWSPRCTRTPTRPQPTTPARPPNEELPRSSGSARWQSPKPAT